MGKHGRGPVSQESILAAAAAQNDKLMERINRQKASIDRLMEERRRMMNELVGLKRVLWVVMEDFMDGAHTIKVDAASLRETPSDPPFNTVTDINDNLVIRREIDD